MNSDLWVPLEGVYIGECVRIEGSSVSALTGPTVSVSALRGFTVSVSALRGPTVSVSALRGPTIGPTLEFAGIVHS